MDLGDQAGSTKDRLQGVKACQTRRLLGWREDHRQLVKPDRAHLGLHSFQSDQRRQISIEAFQNSCEKPTHPSRQDGRSNPSFAGFNKKIYCINNGRSTKVISKLSAYLRRTLQIFALIHKIFTIISKSLASIVETRNLGVCSSPARISGGECAPFGPTERDGMMSVSRRIMPLVAERFGRIRNRLSPWAVRRPVAVRAWLQL